MAAEPKIWVVIAAFDTQATLAKGQSSWNAIRIVGQLVAGRMIK